MNCFTCKKECIMKTEKHMNETPCMVCVRGDKPVDELCAECMASEKVCNFELRKTT